MSFILNSLKVRTRFHSYCHAFSPWMSDCTWRYLVPAFGLAWPGCTTDLPGDRDLRLFLYVPEHSLKPHQFLTFSESITQVPSRSLPSLTLCQRGLAVMMFFRVFIYSWIFPKPSHPQISSSPPAPCGLELCHTCVRERASARTAMWGVEGSALSPALGLLLLGPRSSCSSF